MSEIIIQPACAADMTEVASWIDSPEKLVMWAGTKFSYPVEAAQFADNLSKENVKAFVCKKDKGIVGYGEIGSIDTQKGVAFLCRIIIRPAERGEGIGKQLFRFLVKYCRDELQLQKVYLNVFRNNKHAVELYEKEGFIVMEDKNYVAEFQGVKEEGIRMYYDLNK